MTKLQKEKARWIEKYNELAEKINMPEYKWASGNLKAIRERYTKLYIHYTRTKHIDEPVEWIIKEEEKIIKLENISLNEIKNIGIRAAFISQYYNFNKFWEAIGPNKLFGEINNLWTDFLYADTDAATLSEHFEIFSRNKKGLIN